MVSTENIHVRQLILRWTCFALWWTGWYIRKWRKLKKRVTFQFVTFILIDFNRDQSWTINWTTNWIMYCLWSIETHYTIFPSILWVRKSQPLNCVFIWKSCAFLCASFCASWKSCAHHVLVLWLILCHKCFVSLL